MRSAVWRRGMLLAGLLAGAVALWLEQGREGRAAEAEQFLAMMEFAEAPTASARGESERFMRLTDAVWERVKPDYSGREFARTPAGVLADGRGTCGKTANIMAYYAEAYGLRHRRLWVGPESGSAYLHAFAEIEVEPGRWAVFDPNLLRYAVDGEGRPMSMEAIMREPERSGSELFARIAEECREDASVLREAEAPRYEMPFGRASGWLYRLVGAGGVRALAKGEASAVLGMFAAMMAGGAIAAGRRYGGGSDEAGVEVEVEHGGDAGEGNGGMAKDG